MAEMSLEEGPVPNGLVCHTEVFDFYVQDSGELLKDFKLGYDEQKWKFERLFSYMERLKMWDRLSTKRLLK